MTCLVFTESLRKYPPVSVLNRVCTKSYVIPGTKVTLEKGHLVVVPIAALQTDPKYFPDPEKFDPARFSDQDHAAKTN